MGTIKAMTDTLLELIPGDLDKKAKNLNRLSDVQRNITAVRNEFIGKPEICHKLVSVIILLRREMDVEENTELFFDLWEQYSETLLQEYDIRWLLSVVDTVVDVGDNLESAVAMNISQCVNQCNIHVSLLLNAVDGRLDGNKLNRELKAPTWGGMITVDVPTGDMIHNMMLRLDQVVSTVPMLEEIWREIKNRLCKEETLPLNIICSKSRFKHQRDFFK